MIYSRIPLAVGIAVRLFAKLLGVYIRPEAHGLSLEAPLIGLRQRVHLIRRWNLGFASNIWFYSSLAYSKLSHVLQYKISTPAERAS